jgi:hypothetical protein
MDTNTSTLWTEAYLTYLGNREHRTSVKTGFTNHDDPAPQDTFTSSALPSGSRIIFTGGFEGYA